MGGMRVTKLKKENIQDMYHLSPMQEGMLFHSLLTPETSAYLQQYEILLEGDLDANLLQKSFHLLIERHDVLRTTFIFEKVKRPLQVVFSSWPKDLEFLDLTDVPESGKQDAVESFKLRQLEHRFDLSKDPLIRLALLQTHAEKYTMVISYHHILMDGWSIGIISEELFANYEALRNGDPTSAVRAYPYSRYIDWLSRQDEEQAGRFWRRRLEEYGQTAVVPQQRPSVPEHYDPRELVDRFDLEVSWRIRAFANDQGVTLNSLIQTVWGAVLQRYNQTNDVVFGTVVSGRPADLPGIEQAVGLFINTVPVRVSSSPETSFADLLQQVHRASIEAQPFDHYPLRESQNGSELKQQLLQNLLIFENFPVQALTKACRQERLGFQILEVKLFEQTNYDFNLIVETGDELTIRLSYNAFVYEEAFVRRVSGHLRRFLTAAMERPYDRIGDLDFLGEEEREQILFGFNRTEVPFAWDVLVHQAFEAQAAKTPDRTALVQGVRSMTYRQLNERANQLAHRLRATGVTPGQIIGLMAEPSPEMVAALLAILKAGGAYLPIDPQFPPDRIDYLLKDSGTALLLTETAFLAQVPDTMQSLLLDREELFTGLRDNLPAVQTSRDLVYVIYTSGSTGQPKGVCVTHRNVSNFFAGMDLRVQPQEDDALLAVTTFSFDISVLEQLWTLTRGIQVILPEQKPFERFDRYGQGDLQNMDFSLFFFSSYDHSQEGGKYQLLLDSARFADDNGFTAVWTPERHFHEFGGLYPNPSVISAALAMVTKHLQLRSGSVVSPLHNTLRIAEEWAVVDNLSNGRAGLSFTAGWHADDFALQPDVYKMRHEEMFRQIEEVKRLWRGEKVSVLNGVGQQIEVQTYPRPVQAELPVWVTTSGSRETFVQAGKLGANVLTHLLGQDTEELAENIGLYRRTLEEHGYAADSGRIALMLHTYIGDELEVVKAMVRKPFCDYLRSSLSLIRNLAQTLNVPVDQLGDEETMQTLLDYGFERYWQTSALLGTQESCKQLVRRLAAIGVDEIACLVDFGLAPDDVIQGLKQLATLRATFKEETAVKAKVMRPVTMLQSTPSRLKALVKEEGSRRFLRSLRTILVGGEPFPSDLATELKRMTDARLFNMYGPTETTVWSAAFELSRENNQLCIGTPIANTQIYILDENGQPVPIGIPGEVCIGGEGVTEGYWNRPELTSERFVPNRFTEHGHLYKTGDLGRFRADGSIELLGRLDDQVKVRGYRIETGEIETLLQRYDGIREAVVLDREDQAGERYLCAYLVSNQPVQEQAVRSHLSRFLPYYMIPTQFIQIDRIPLTPNGKIDRKTLRASDYETNSSQSGYVVPRSEVENILVDIWEKVLGRQPIGIHDNFFKLGGDSIRALQIVSALMKYDYKADIKHLFEYPTIAQMSLFVQKKERKVDGCSAGEEGEVTLTPIQHWFFEQDLTDPHHYNHAVLIKGRHGLDERAAKAALQALVEHHDALRMVFVREGTAVRAHNRLFQDSIFGWRVFDFRAELNLEDRMEREANHLQAGLSLAKGPLVQGALMKTQVGDHLLLVIHHLVVDGISWRILLGDFSIAYQQALQGETVSLGDKTMSFQEYAARLAQYAQSDALWQERDYWMTLERADLRPLPNLKSLAEGPRMLDSALETVIFTPEETRRLLQDANHAYNTEINDLLLTALARAVHQWTGLNQVLIDLEGHGREPFEEDLDVSRTVGWFTSLYPVLLDALTGDDIGGQIKYIKESLRRIPNKGLGYGVLKYLTRREGERALPSLASQILFNYLGQFDQTVPQDLLLLSDLPVGRAISPRSERLYALLINGRVIDSVLTISFDYHNQQFDRAQVREFAELYRDQLLMLIDHCASRKTIELTPSDLYYNDLSIEELDELTDEVAATLKDLGLEDEG